MLRSRWQPFTEMRQEMGRLQDEMNRVFRRYGNGNWSPSGAATYPALNLWEDEDNLFVEAELPGMELEDLEIYVNAGNQLTIKGERKQPVAEQGIWHRQERGQGAFSRAVELPTHVDTDKVTAELKQGVLLVRLPKREEAKPRKISVKAE